MNASLSKMTTEWQAIPLLLKAVMGATLLAICSQIAIPLQPVPITLHTFAISLIALTHTPKETGSSIGLYLGLGLMGLPIFSHFSGGLEPFLSPRGGYFVGFLLGGVAMSWVAHSPLIKGLHLKLGLAALTGFVVLYTCGLMGLMRFMDFQAAIHVGLIPFVMPGLVKSALLVGVLGYLKPRS